MTPPAALTPGALDELRECLSRHDWRNYVHHSEMVALLAIATERDALAAELAATQISPLSGDITAQDLWAAYRQTQGAFVDAATIAGPDHPREVALCVAELAAQRDAALADLAKAREELSTAQAQVAALIAHHDEGTVAKPVYDLICAESQRLAEKLAALEARAADEAVNADFILNLIENPPAPTPAMVALFANAPAAPAKAMFTTGAICARCGRADWQHVDEQDCPAPFSPLAAQLAEAVALLREAAPDSWWTPNRDDWRTRRAALLDAIDAGRARAT